MRRPTPLQHRFIRGAKSKPPMSSALWPPLVPPASINFASKSCLIRNVHAGPLNSPSGALARRVLSFKITVNTVCHSNHQFAAGRAAVKPACRFSAGPRAEARIRIRLIRPVHNPPPESTLRRGLSYHSPAGSVSERKSLGNQTQRPTGVLCRALRFDSCGRDTRFCLHKPVSLSRAVPDHSSFLNSK